MDLAQIEAFFFRAMMAGWATDSDSSEIDCLPGHKAILYSEGDLRLLDLYCVNPNSPKTTGTTTIWFKDVPVWVMHYGGFYKDSAIAILKNALRKTYKDGVFVGCRGPMIFQEDSLVYVNRLHIGNFGKFEGREEVFRPKDGVSLGYHEYWGMSLT